MFSKALCFIPPRPRRYPSPPHLSGLGRSSVRTAPAAESSSSVLHSTVLGTSNLQSVNFLSALSLIPSAVVIFQLFYLHLFMNSALCPWTEELHRVGAK